MKQNRAYTVTYRLHSSSHFETISILASDRYDAYDKAVFEVIPNVCGKSPYSAWVSSVTYQNGNYHRFNTFEGKPF